MATTFQWSGKTTKGTVESGQMSAASKDEVIAKLRSKNITPTIITETEKKPFLSLSFL